MERVLTSRLEAMHPPPVPLKPRLEETRNPAACVGGGGGGGAAQWGKKKKKKKDSDLERGCCYWKCGKGEPETKASTGC